MSTIFLFISFFFISLGASEQEYLLLTESSIGGMKIERGMDVSVQRLRLHFPDYAVGHKIAQGDSPDYHLFTISAEDGEVLFKMHSYIEDQDEYKNSTVKLDELVSCHSKIRDQFGLSPSMHVSRALKNRSSLVFGAGHNDNFLGNGMLWYMFSVEGTHATQLSEEAAIKADPPIDCISWPRPIWQ